jgi:hypothetical protein
MAGKRKTLVMAQETSIFGEVEESLVNDTRRDIFEMPGYSDKRRQFEMDRRDGKAVPPLPFRVQLVPVQRATGQPEYRKVSERIGMGYKLISPEELETRTGEVYWDENGNPLTSYQKGPDGTVRLNEYAVMVCDGKQAAANLAAVQRRNRELEEGGLQRTALSGSASEDMVFELDGDK